MKIKVFQVFSLVFTLSTRNENKYLINTHGQAYHFLARVLLPKLFGVDSLTRLASSCN